jgi:hypothetical protein
MVRRTAADSVVEHALGSLGLLLFGLIGWAADRLQRRTPIDAVLARLVLGCVTAVGWVVDRLPLPDPHRRDREDARKHAAFPGHPAFYGPSRPKPCFKVQSRDHQYPDRWPFLFL